MHAPIDRTTTGMMTPAAILPALTVGRAETGVGVGAGTHVHGKKQSCPFTR